MDNKLMENIFAANNKQRLTEGDLFVGANGKVTEEKDVEDREDFSVPDFVKESFGYDEDGNDTAHTETEDDAEKEVDDDPIENDDDTCPECGKSGDECTCETVEGVEPPEAGPSFNIDTSDDGWLDLNTLKDDDVFAKVIDLISVNFNHEAAVEGGTDMGFSVIQVKGVTDKKEIKDIIDLIQGTLNSGSYYLNNYRLNDGNLELKVEY
jgi:hypothetical protein